MQKPVKGLTRDENGVLIVNVAAMESNGDWIRAARLARRAEEGDQEAAQELERMDQTPMMQDDGE